MNLSTYIQVVEAAKKIPKPPVTFDPYTQIEKSIVKAANSVHGYFQEVQAAISKGAKVQAAIKKQKLQAVMHQVIASSRMAGFVHGAKTSKKKLSLDYGPSLYSDSAKRAKAVSKMMRKTSSNLLTADPKGKYVLSKDRALAAARHEAVQAYFQGVADAFKGMGFKKRWVTSPLESCERCDEAEAVGYIGMEASWPHGPEWPQLHLNCRCFVEVQRD